MGVLILFKDRDMERPEPENLGIQLKLLLKNPRYISIFIAFMFCFGTFKGFGVTVPFMVNYYKYPPTTMAYLGIHSRII